MKPLHTFEHEAMKTTFSIRTGHDDRQEAAAVARACFTLLDEIEGALSRYIMGSDVWQINHMKAGDELFVSDTCHDCLRIALDLHRRTHGLFDITLGQRVEHVKNELPGDAPAPHGILELDPERPAIRCREAGREIDLGGIGKGYALDRILEVLRGWEMPSALIAAGASTQLAFGPRTWPVKLRGDSASLEIELRDAALSASGTGIQGSHIVAPWSDPLDYAYKRIWIVDQSAATADALTTAAMLMSPDELLNLSKSVDALYVDAGEIQQLATTA